MTDTNARAQFDRAVAETRDQRLNVLNAIRAVERSRSLPSAQVNTVLGQLHLPTHGTEVAITLPHADHLSDAGLRHHAEQLIQSQTEFRQNVQQIVQNVQRTYPRNVSTEDVQSVFRAAGIEQQVSTSSDPWSTSSTGASRTITITANVSGSTAHDGDIEREIRNLAGRAGLNVHQLQVDVRNIA